MKPYKIWGVVLILTIVAAGLRYWQLTTLPPGYWNDEGHKSIVALEISRGLLKPLYVTDIEGIEAGYFWLLAGWFKLFGLSYFGTRALAALLGTLTIPITFWSVRALYANDSKSTRIALISAVILTLLFWHILYSRFGIETITVPLFSIVVIGTIAWAWQQDSLWGFALAGAVLGLSQYTNPGARVLPVQALFTFFILAGFPNLKFSKICIFGLAYLIGAFVIYAPLGWFFINNPEWFFKRLSSVSTGTRGSGIIAYGENALKTLLAINFIGDSNPRQNLALRPIFDPFLSIWMWIGLSAMFLPPWRSYWRRHLTLVSAIAINLIPTIFSDGTPSFGRMLGAAPLLVIVPAFGIVASLNNLKNTPYQLGRILIAGSLALSGLINIYDYFIRYPSQPGMFDAFEVGLWTLTQSAVNASQTDTVYLLVGEGELYNPTVRLARELSNGELRIVNGRDCFVYLEDIETPTVYVTLPTWVPEILEKYPGASRSEILNESNQDSYASVLRIPAGVTSAVINRNPLVTYGNSIELSAIDLPNQTFAPGETVPISLRWRASASIQEQYTSFLHLVGENRPFVAGVDSEPCEGWYPTNQWHPGELIETQLLLALPPDLPAGRYDLAIGWYVWTTGERLPITQPENQREPDRAFVTFIMVK